MKRIERGSVLPLMGLFMATAAGAMLLLAYVTSALIHASWAQTAADAAALAGASRGEAGANTAATANRGQLISFRVDGTDTLVTVKSGSQTKSARARNNGLTFALAQAQ
jgi:hypothetical protein